MTDYFWVGLGSALGGMGRYWLAGMIDHRHATKFPWGTFVVNVSGCFVMGLLATWAFTDRRVWLVATGRLLLLVGFLGGYTTFSAFSWQTLQLMREGSWLAAGGNALGSLVLCMGAVALGHVLGTWIQRAA